MDALIGLVVLVLVLGTLFSIHGKLTRLHGDLVKIARLLGDPNAEHKTKDGRILQLEGFTNVNGSLLKITRMLEKQREPTQQE
jgi:hypothetical protein